MTETEASAVPGRKEYLKKLAKRKPGITTNKMKGVKATDVVPFDPSNITKPKAQFVKDRKIAKLVAVKVKDATAKIKKEAQLEVEEEISKARDEAIDEIVDDRGEKRTPDAPDETPVDADDSDNLSNKTVAQLKEIAKDEGIEVLANAKKDDIIKLIMDAE